MGCFESKLNWNDVYCSSCQSKATYRFYKEIPIKHHLFSTDDYDLQEFLQTPIGRAVAPYIVQTKAENGTWKILAYGCQKCIFHNSSIFEHHPFGFSENP